MTRMMIMTLIIQMINLSNIKTTLQKMKSKRLILLKMLINLKVFGRIL